MIHRGAPWKLKYDRARARNLYYSCQQPSLVRTFVDMGADIPAAAVLCD